MRLLALTLENFRPYAGKTELKFPDRTKGELVLIHGLNGYGKTSLHSAVQWALYGEATRRELYDHANSRALHEGDFRMSVGLTFAHDDEEYWLLREATSNRNPVEAPEHIGRSTLTLYRNGAPLRGGEQEVAQERIESIIPRDASQFFFFDGEQIGRYSSSAHTDETRQAIELVLGLKAAQNARSDANQLKADLRRERNRSMKRTEEQSELIEHQERLEREIEILNREADEIASRLSDLTARRQQYREELDQLGEIQVFASERDRLDQSRKDVLTQRASIIENLSKESRGLYLRVLLPKISEAAEACELVYEEARERETGQRLHDSIREFLQKLTTEGDCVCGRPMTPEHQRAILERMPDEDKPESEDDEPDRESLTQIATRLELLRKARVKASVAAHRYDEFQVAKVDLDEKLEGVESALVEVENRINSIDVENINSLRDLLERTDEELSLRERERLSVEVQITAKKEEADKFDKKIAKLGGATSITRALEAQIDLLDRAERAFDEFLLRAARGRRSQVEEQANEFFRDITNKDFGYDCLFIGDDFTFGIRANDGTSPNMDQIAAGEKQVVAFSFIMGLNRYNRSTAPLMIDTPMGRLDTVHRVNLARAFANLDQQVFLFVTDTDLGFGVDEIIREGVDCEFEIVHDQHTLTSTIRPRIA